MKALALANYLVEDSICRRAWVSNLQLQKILYCLQLRSLKESSWRHPLLDDDFEAWRCGPVVREVYWAYSRNAGLKIMKVARMQDARLAMSDVPAWVEACFDAIMQQRPGLLINFCWRMGGAWQRSYVCGMSCSIPLALMAEEARQISAEKEKYEWLS